jgi:hypothetical protein
MADLRLICKDCKAEFIFEQGEQDWYAEKGFSQPKRCPDCRLLNRQRKEQREANRA